MIQRVIETNGVKSLQPLSNSVQGSSLPLGTVVEIEGDLLPSGYLWCDGSTFDTDKYPALYMLLGTNVLPKEPILETVPDWTKAQTISSGFEAPSYGYVSLSAGATNGLAGSTYINGVEVTKSTGYYGSWADLVTYQGPVKPGDKITWNQPGTLQKFTPTETGRYKAIKAVSGYEADQENTLFNLIKKYTNDQNTPDWSKAYTLADRGYGITDLYQSAGGVTIEDDGWVILESYVGNNTGYWMINNVRVTNLVYGRGMFKINKGDVLACTNNNNFSYWIVTVVPHK